MKHLAVHLPQIRRWTLFAVLPALLISVVAYVYTAHQTKTYQTTVILYVQAPTPPGSSLPGSTDVFGSEALIPTYIQMITTPVIETRVDRAMAKRFPGYRLEEYPVTVGGSSPATASTQLMDISVTDSNPVRAAIAANTLASVFTRYISHTQAATFKTAQRDIQRQLTQAQANIQYISGEIGSYHGGGTGLSTLKSTLAGYQAIYQTLVSSADAFSVNQGAAVQSVKVFSPAPLPGTPLGPNPKRSMIVAAFVALLLFGAAVYGYDYLDDSLRSPDEVEEIVGAPVLGMVQRFDVNRLGGQLVASKQPRSPMAEAYRMIRTNIQFARLDNPPRTLLVTSPLAQEGKSTTAGNLAEVFAEGGQRVTLVDADLRRPSLHHIFEIAAGRHEGLTSMLVGNQLNGHGIHQAEHPNLAVVASGPLPPNPADLLGSSRMRGLLDHFHYNTGLVVIDSPPVLSVTDAAILSTIVDGVILVIDLKRTKRRSLTKTREAIEGVGGKIIGVVINRLNSRGSPYYYAYAEYGYGYGYGYETGLTRPEKVSVS